MKQQHYSLEREYALGELLKKYRKLHGMKQDSLADALGVSRTTVINWETERCLPDVEMLRGICTILDIPPYELLGVDGGTVPDYEENELLSIRRCLSPSGKRLLLRIAGDIQEEENRVIADSYLILRVEATPAAAGQGCEFLDAGTGYAFVKRSRQNSDADAIVRVSGASMEPKYYDGDLVYVRYTSYASDGDDVICSTADGAVIKRLENSQLRSLNPKYPFGNKSEDDRVTVLARVLGTVGAGELASREENERLRVLKEQELRLFLQKNGESARK